MPSFDCDDNEAKSVSCSRAQLFGSLLRICHELHMAKRRFPSPWTVDELEACFVVKDDAGQKLAYVYYEDEPGRRSAAKLLTKARSGGSR